MSLMKAWVLYTLADPRAPDDIRYVGKTVGTPKRRLNGHLSYARRTASRCHLVCWLRSLIAEGLTPEIKVIERGDGDWREAECRQIAWYRGMGYRLCNSTDGGEGMSPGYTPSPETRAKIAAAAKGRVHSVESRAKMSAARKGRGPILTAASYVRMSQTKTGKPGPKPTPETIAKRIVTVKATWVQKKKKGWRPTPCSPEGRARTTAALTGRKHSPEAKAKISTANKGLGLGRKLSPETRARMSAAQIKRNQTLKSVAREAILQGLDPVTACLQHTEGN